MKGSAEVSVLEGSMKYGPNSPCAYPYHHNISELRRAADSQLSRVCQSSCVQGKVHQPLSRSVHPCSPTKAEAWNVFLLLDGVTCRIWVPESRL